MVITLDSLSKSDDNIYNIDIKTIILNAKNNKIFHKLLNLCIKYDIQLFNQNKDNYIIYDTQNILIQCDLKQKKIIEELSKKINDLTSESSKNTWLLDIDKLYNEYKKMLKEIEIIIYILKNTYDNSSLINMCCSHTTSSSSNYKNSYKKNNENIVDSKYIAIYSN